MHEDLLCRNAQYFKQTFQTRRREIEGECLICRDDLDPKADDVTFCRSPCGQNYHEKCIERWDVTAENGATCPICRRVWQFKPKELVDVPEDAHLDHDAVESYVEWLYTKKLDFGEDSTRYTTQYELRLLKAWTVADVFKDEGFKNCIVAEFVAWMDKDVALFGRNSVRYAYEEQCIASMREFVLDVWLMHNTLGFISHLFKDLPNEFARELCLALMLRTDWKDMKLKDLLKKHTGGEYDVEAEAQE